MTTGQNTTDELLDLVGTRRPTMGELDFRDVAEVSWDNIKELPEY